MCLGSYKIKNKGEFEEYHDLCWVQDLDEIKKYKSVISFNILTASYFSTLSY